MLVVAHKKIGSAFSLEPIFPDFGRIWLILPQFSMVNILWKGLKVQICIQNGCQRIELIEILDQSDIQALEEKKQLLISRKRLILADFSFFFAIFLHLITFNFLILMQNQFKSNSPCSDLLKIMISIVFAGTIRIWIPLFHHSSQFSPKISQNQHFSANQQLFLSLKSLNITLIEYFYQFDPLTTLLNAYLHFQAFPKDVDH